VRLEIFAVLVIGTICAAALHTAYRLAGLATALPSTVFIAAAAFRAEGLGAASLAVTAISAALIAGVWIASGRIGETADRRFPRTGLVRREIERGGEATAPTESAPLAKTAG
jgi:hypothetical protein